jgi:hypothetical protein
MTLDQLVALMIRGLFILLLIAAVVLFIVLVQVFRSARQQQRRNARNSWSVGAAPPRRGKTPAHLERRLLVLLNGDRDAAKRLIELARLQTAGKSDQWYWEKVIFDLEHDRGYR